MIPQTLPIIHIQENRDGRALQLRFDVVKPDWHPYMTRYDFQVLEDAIRSSTQWQSLIGVIDNRTSCLVEAILTERLQWLVACGWLKNWEGKWIFQTKRYCEHNNLQYRPPDDDWFEEVEANVKWEKYRQEMAEYLDTERELDRLRATGSATEAIEDEYADKLERLWWKLTKDERAKVDPMISAFDGAAQKAVADLHKKGVSAWGRNEKGELVEAPPPQKSPSPAPNQQSFLRRLCLWVRDSMLVPKDGLAREEWFLKRRILRTQDRLQDIKFNEWGDPEDWFEYSRLNTKLERQKTRLKYLEKRKQDERV